MRAVMWFLPVLGSIIGGLVFFFDVLLKQEISAPQEAAGAAIALGWAVLPYVFARSIDEMNRPSPIKVPRTETERDLS